MTSNTNYKYWEKWYHLRAYH